jgi:hypothetical protein
LTLRFNTILLLLTLFTIVGCSDIYLDDANQDNFTKLYRANDDVEAVDFIIKPDKSGFLVLGNSKSIVLTEFSSNMIIYDINNQGYVKNTVELKTNDFDEGEKIYLNDNNEVYLLGRRTKEKQQITIIVKTDLNANFLNYTDTANYEEVRELSFDENDNLISFVMNDIGILDQTLILAGYIEQNGNKNALARTYSLNSLFDSLTIPVNHINQVPLNSNINYDNSVFKNIGLSEYDNYPLCIYGQKINNDGEIDITHYLFNSISDFRYISPNIYTPKNQNLNAYYINEVDGSIIFVGNNQNTELGDSIFIMRAAYSPTLSSDSINYNILSIDYLGGYGNEVIDIAQTTRGDILIASVSDDVPNVEILSRTGDILKFSFLANAIPSSRLTLSIAGNGFQNIKKIRYDGDSNITYILSGVTLGTEETAIELSKVMF